MTSPRSSYPKGTDVCWLTRNQPQVNDPFESMLRENFRSLEMHAGVPPEGISANVVVFDLNGFSVRQLFKFRRQYTGGLIGVYQDNPPAEVIRLLEHGIDDCIERADQRLLLARIRSLLTRAHLGDETLNIEIKGWRFDKQTMVVTPPMGEHLGLSTGQAKLMGFLLEHEGQVISRDDISEHVYGEPWAYGNRKIDMAIGALRRKLLEAGVGARIKTIANKGYFITLTCPGEEPTGDEGTGKEGTDC